MGERRPGRSVRSAEVDHRRGDAGRSQEIDLDRTVDRGVEAHRRGSVHDDVARREDAPPLVVQAETVPRHITRDRR